MFMTAHSNGRRCDTTSSDWWLAQLASNAIWPRQEGKTRSTTIVLCHFYASTSWKQLSVKEIIRNQLAPANANKRWIFSSLHYMYIHKQLYQVIHKSLGGRGAVYVTTYRQSVHHMGRRGSSTGVLVKTFSVRDYVIMGHSSLQSNKTAPSSDNRHKAMCPAHTTLQRALCCHKAAEKSRRNTRRHRRACSMIQLVAIIFRWSVYYTGDKI